MFNIPVVLTTCCMRGIEWDGLVDITVVPINVFISCNIIRDGLNLMILAPWAVGSHWSLNKGANKLWTHDDVIKWKYFRYYWSFVSGIHQSPVNLPHKGQWCGASIFSLICAWIYTWVNSREACDLRCHHPHYDIMVMNKKMLNFESNGGNFFPAN